MADSYGGKRLNKCWPADGSRGRFDFFVIEHEYIPDSYW